jgi:oxygen-independent coproporphyrinogen-3 oxidase
MPERYLEGLSLQNYTAQTNLLAAETLIAEFMLNALRLRIGSSLTQFEASTGLNPDVIAEPWRQLKREGLMVESPTLLRTTDRGWRFLNTVIERFLD